jgi:flavodoxin
MVVTMKTLIISVSIHHKNTEKVAKVMAVELAADLLSLDQVQSRSLAEYDLIGFGSGIYFMKHHKTLLQFVETLPAEIGRRAFIFSTSGAGGIRKHAALREKLVYRGFSIVGEFSCKGWDTFGLLKLIGGMNKGRPNAEDLEGARVFARGLKNKMESITSR